MMTASWVSGTTIRVESNATMRIATAIRLSLWFCQTPSILLPLACRRFQLRRLVGPALDLRQRQVARHPGRLDDHLVGLAQDALHGLVIHTPAGDFGRELVLGVDLVERGRVALGAGEHLLRDR